MIVDFIVSITILKNAVFSEIMKRMALQVVIKK